MQLQLTTKEQAIALKELGFDVSTDDFYTNGREKPWNKWTDENAHLAHIADFCCSAPTVVLAIKWLREVKEISVEVCETDDIFTDKDWVAYIKRKNKPRETCNVVYGGTYDQAESTGLDAAIKYLKEK